MKPQYQISITLDKRRKNKDGKYPVRLQVFTPSPRVQKRYATKFAYTEDEFNSIWLTVKPRKIHQEARQDLKDLEAKANAVAKEMDSFTFDEFDRKLDRKMGEGASIKYHYDQVIKEYTDRGRLGSVNTYKYSMESLKHFVEVKRKKTFDKLEFVDVTAAWLNDYEQFMIEDKERSITSVGIYLRALKAIYNRGIDQGEVHRDQYPFGKRKYQIPSGRNVKKALTQKQLKKLFEAIPATPEEEKARDFWFFSFAANGMNPKDIALLKHKNILDGRIEFIRSKTRTTSKASLTPIVVHLNDFLASVIEKYETTPSPNSYVFDILRTGMTPGEIQRKVGLFVRFINEHIKRLAKANGLPGDISSYWARHSFATNAIRRGASMEFMQESLGHSSMKVTQNYFAGFDDDAKKEFSKKVMDFGGNINNGQSE